jgi:MoaA/NifB/PqqE/SkfB family radical SAM enzyme
MCYTDCYNTPQHISEELSTREILRIMDEMKEAGVLDLVLTGGEPMSRPDFEEIYVHAVTSGFLVTLFTNGAFVDEYWIELWKRFPPQMIEISFHGIRENTFDAVTGMRGSHKRVQRSLRLLLENSLPLTLKTTGLTLNHEEVLEVKKYARTLPNVYFRFGNVLRPLVNGDQDPRQYQIPDDRIAQIYSEDPEFTQALDRQEEEEKQNSGCHEGRSRFHIDAYGNLQLCSSNRRQSYSLRTGNFREGFYEYLPHFACPNKAQKDSQEGRRTGGSVIR